MYVELLCAKLFYVRFEGDSGPCHTIVAWQMIRQASRHNDNALTHCPGNCDVGSFELQEESLMNVIRSKDEWKSNSWPENIDLLFGQNSEIVRSYVRVNDLNGLTALAEWTGDDGRIARHYAIHLLRPLVFEKPKQNGEVLKALQRLWHSADVEFGEC